MCGLVCLCVQQRKLCAAWLFALVKHYDADAAAVECTLSYQLSGLVLSRGLGCHAAGCSQCLQRLWASLSEELFWCVCVCLCVKRPALCRFVYGWHSASRSARVDQPEAFSLLSHSWWELLCVCWYCAAQVCCFWSNSDGKLPCKDKPEHLHRHTAASHHQHVARAAAAAAAEDDVNCCQCCVL